MSVSSWEPDPTGRHKYRWFDGEEWTDQVADDGVQSVDPITSSEASLPRDARPSPPPPPSSVPGQSTPDSGSLPPDTLLMLSSSGRRLGAIFLEILLVAFTFAIGWLIWALIVYSHGQTTAKQLLKMRVVRLEDRQTPDFALMALRELVLKAIPSSFILGLLWVAINGVVLLTNDRLQTLWDKMLKTVFIDDPDDSYKPHPYSRDRLWEQ